MAGRSPITFPTDHAIAAQQQWMEKLPLDWAIGGRRIRVSIPAQAPGRGFTAVSTAVPRWTRLSSWASLRPRLLISPTICAGPTPTSWTRCEAVIRPTLMLVMEQVTEAIFHRERDRVEPQIIGVRAAMARSYPKAPLTSQSHPVTLVP